ncbi:MAG: hypothetical protein L3J95_04670 [Thermoplasmata archaeon]|nr:hypothetical protein [Thermoplasmata archaeon]MCI4359699.1 hypothetical protein [Thermoplasmata archaeon]
MTARSFDRYGLTSNPFLDLASENLEDVELFHVNLKIDETLRTLKDDVLDRENRALVAIVGPLGSGKTERLRLADSEARQRKAFSVYVDVAERATTTLQNLSKAFEDAARAAGLLKTFSGPKWLGKVHALRKVKEGSYDPGAAGKNLAAALNESAPSFLLLNDLHNLAQQSEALAFSKVLQEMADEIRPGVLILVGSYSGYFDRLLSARPVLATRVNRTITLPGLSDEQACLMLAKKLLSKRLVENLDPFYPFTKDAILSLNHAAMGNPRRLLSLADLALQHGIDHRAYRIDRDVVRAVLVAQVTTSKSVTSPRTGSSRVGIPPPERVSPSTSRSTPSSGGPPQAEPLAALPNEPADLPSESTLPAVQKVSRG